MKRRQCWWRYFFTLADAGAPRQAQSQQITHFYTITSHSLPAHGWVQVSPVCLPLCANFRPIICCNKCAMGRVTFALIVCTQRGSLPPHHGSKVSSIVSNFLLPFLATVCCFFSLSQPDPNCTVQGFELDTAVSDKHEKMSFDLRGDCRRADR